MIGCSPLYSYRADDTSDTTTFSALWMFWRTTSPTTSQTSLFPIGSMTTDEATGETSWSLIGLEPVIPISWARHTWTPEGSRGSSSRSMTTGTKEISPSCRSVESHTWRSIVKKRPRRTEAIDSSPLQLPTGPHARRNTNGIFSWLTNTLSSLPAGSKDTFIPLVALRTARSTT